MTQIWLDTITFVLITGVLVAMIWGNIINSRKVKALNDLAKVGQDVVTEIQEKHISFRTHGGGTVHLG